MMIQRKIETALLEMAEKFPVVTIIDPRQSGKTTLTKMVFPAKDYISLEELDIRQFAANDPVVFNALPGRWNY
jgi:hypothetical protein